MLRSARSRRWVCHFPPATSKWNKIEHRLLSFISLNWRGKPLETRQVVIDLIAATATRTALKVYAQLDERTYPKQLKVTDAELATVRITATPSTPNGTTPSNHDVDQARALN